MVDGGNPEAYVRRAMINEHISWWRRRRGMAVVTVDSPLECTADGHEETVVPRVALQAALAQADPQAAGRAGAALLRRPDRGGDRLDAGLHRGTVKSQTHHALARLRSVAPELAALLGDRDLLEVPS